jgi:hypothetical protein
MVTQGSRGSALRFLGLDGRTGDGIYPLLAVRAVCD